MGYTFSMELRTSAICAKVAAVLMVIGARGSRPSTLSLLKTK